jgi:hypothetical protein
MEKTNSNRKIDLTEFEAYTKKGFYEKKALMDLLSKIERAGGLTKGLQLVYHAYCETAKACQEDYFCIYESIIEHYNVYREKDEKTHGNHVHFR